MASSNDVQVESSAPAFTVIEAGNVAKARLLAAFRALELEAKLAKNGWKLRRGRSLNATWAIHFGMGPRTSRLKVYMRMIEELKANGFIVEIDDGVQPATNDKERRA